jgi:hypothetical protein
MRALVSGRLRGPSTHSTRSSLRTIRLRARTPRILMAVLVAVLCAAGLRSILSPRSSGAQAEAVASGPSYDLGAGAFAQSFASAYLTWGGELTEGQREVALKPFLAEGIDANGGLAPAADTSESVQATQVAEENRVGEVTDVVVIAETTNGTRYVSVPVARNSRGLLTVVSYPALVGPPASDPSRPAPTLQPVGDKGLVTVVSRALGNYLAGHAANLRADLTPDAVVSMPAQALELRETASVSWLVPGRTVDVQVDVKDGQGAHLTLAYQLGVVRHDRWYVDSVQFDPTLEGGI